MAFSKGSRGAPSGLCRSSIGVLRGSFARGSFSSGGPRGRRQGPIRAAVRRIRRSKRNVGEQTVGSSFASGHDLVVIVDLGSRHSQLIAKQIRGCPAYWEIWPPGVPVDEFRRRKVKGIVLAGPGAGGAQPGAAAGAHPGAAGLVDGLLELGIPALAVGPATGLMAAALGGTVRPGRKEQDLEAGARARLEILSNEDLFKA